MELRPGYKQTEVGVIPEDWKLLTVSSIASSAKNAIVGGPFGSDLTSKDYVEKGIPVIRGQNMGQQFISGSFAFVSPAKAASLSSNLARPQDLVVTQRGTIGQVSIVPELTYDYYLVSQSQMKVTLNESIANPLFIYYLLTGTIHQQRIIGDTIQTGVPHINLGILKKIPLQIPPLPEQRAIATALSDVDELIGALGKLIAKKRAIKQAAMQQLLTGKTRLPGFSGAWEETTLGQIGEPIIGLTYKPENTAEHGLLVLRSSNIRNGRLTFDDNIFVNISVPERLLTCSGDILVCVRNGSRALIGKCAVIDETTGGLTFGAFMSVFRTEKWRYIFHVFQSGDIQRQIHDNIGATINQITNKDMKSFHVKLPPEEEQNAIAAVLNDMDAEITALEQRRDKTKQIKQGMMQELLTGRIRLVEPSPAEA